MKHVNPVPGECNQNGDIYQETVSTNDGQVESYVGLARYFKKRYIKPRATLTNSHTNGQTELSNFVLEQRDEGKDPKIFCKS